VATIEPTVVRELTEVARTAGTTLFTALLTAHLQVLTRYRDDGDVVIGVPTAGRDAPGSEDAIGFFNQTVALRWRRDDADSGRGALERVRVAWGDSINHAHVPFDRLVAELAPVRTGVENPFFSTWFNYLSYPTQPVAMTGLAVTVESVPPLGALFDLTVYLTRTTGTGEGAIGIDVLYDPDVLDADRVAQYVDHLDAAARGLASAPDAPARGYLDPRATEPLPVDPIAAGSGGDRPLVAATAAVEAGKARLAGPDLLAAVETVRARLIDAGIGAGDVVAITTGRTVGLPVALAAVRASRAAFWVVDPHQPPARRDRMAAAAAPAASLAGDGPDLTVTPSLPPVGPIGSNGGDRTASLPPEVAYVVFTSGSTGEPRGVLGAAEPLATFFDWYTNRYALSPHDRFSVLAGLGHDPLLRETLLPLRLGATVCVPGEDVAGNPPALLEWLASSAVSVVHLTPALLRLLDAAGRSAGRDLPMVRLVALGGGAVHSGEHAAASRLFPNARAISFYGTTETPQGVSVVELADEFGDHTPLAPPLGRGTATARLLVVDSSGRPAAIGEPGEVGVQSEHLALGYLHDPVATAQRFVGSAALRRYLTGDAGRRRPDGMVEYLGRRDRQLSIDGHRIEPDEIEQRAREFAGVDDCAVVPHDGTLVLAVAGTAAATPAAVLAWLRAQLPYHMVPRAVLAVPAIPLNPNNKPDLVALTALVGTARVDSGAPSAEPLAEAVRRVWTEVLERATVAATENFFDSGGTSQKLVELARRLKSDLELPVEAVDLFRFPTVQSLVAHLQASDTPDEPARPRTTRAAAGQRNQRIAARRFARD
jgi:amino acid adenylation domain-containing protein